MKSEGHMTTLPWTGAAVPRLGLGLAALGRPGYINVGHGDDFGAGRSVEAMAAQSHEVLDAAWNLGIRYFDAARSYGRAEQFLGEWLRQRGIEPGAVVVASKWGYRYTAHWQVKAEDHEIKEHSLPMLQRQWVESMERLGTQLDLYQIHSATFESGVLENEAVLQELARLKRAHGVAIGLSLSGPRQGEVLAKAMTVRVGQERLFDAVQATWNLLEPSAEPVLAAADGDGMTVIVKEALANGRLTDRNDDPEFREKKPTLQAEAARLDTTLDGLALAAVLAKPWASVVLSGAATVDQLRSNWRALDVLWDQKATATLATLAESPSQYWEHRDTLEWN